MTKYEWERELKKNIYRLPESETLKVIDFYNELFEDKAESGKSEADIIAEFGNPFDVAHRIMSEYEGELLDESPTMKGDGTEFDPFDDDVPHFAIADKINDISRKVNDVTRRTGEKIKNSFKQVFGGAGNGNADDKANTGANGGNSYGYTGNVSPENSRAQTTYAPSPEYSPVTPPANDADSPTDSAKGNEPAVESDKTDAPKKRKKRWGFFSVLGQIFGWFFGITLIITGASFIAAGAVGVVMSFITIAGSPASGLAQLGFCTLGAGGGFLILALGIGTIKGTVNSARIRSGG